MKPSKGWLSDLHPNPRSFVAVWIREQESELDSEPDDLNILIPLTVITTVIRFARKRDENPSPFEIEDLVSRFQGDATHFEIGCFFLSLVENWHIYNELEDLREIVLVPLSRGASN